MMTFFLRHQNILHFEMLVAVKIKNVAAVFRYNNHHVYIKYNKGDLMGVLVNKSTSELSTLY